MNENLLTSRERVKVSVGSLSSIDRDFNGLICNKGTQGVFLGADLGNLNLSTLTGDIVMVAAGKLKIYGRIEADGNLAKKIPKYFTTSRTANFDGISCLAYDIDINTLTNFETIDSINFRFFRIKIFFASGVMSYQRTPRSFDISMSNYNTLSISCVENDGYFSELDRASNSSYFLYKQNFNMITVCFPVSLFGSTNIKIAYIIEDLLGK